MQEIFEFILPHLTEIALVLGVFVEVTPIKLNPITAVFKFIGRAINKDIVDKVDSLDKKIDENEIDRIRWEIFAFANSCRKGRKHTYKEFEHIMDINKKYHNMLEKRGLTNGQLDLEYEFIENIFKHCQEENSFL